MTFAATSLQGLCLLELLHCHGHAGLWREADPPFMIRNSYLNAMSMMLSGLPSAAHAESEPGTKQWNLAVAMAWLPYHRT